MSKPASQAEHIANSEVCPFCKSSDVIFSDISADSEGASQHATCNKCGKTWMDIYELVGHEEVK